MKINKIIKIIISLVIFLILIKIIGIEKILGTLYQIKIYYLIPIFLLYGLIIIIGAWSIDILLKSLNKHIKFLKLFKYTIISWSVGLISPGKLGEFSIVYFLKKEKIKLGTGFAIILTDKIITLIVLLIFTLVTAALLLTKKEVTYTIIGILVIIFGICLLSLKKLRTFIGGKILRKYSRNFKGFYKTIIFLIKKKKKYLIINFIVTIAKWLVSAIVTSLIFLSLNAKANIFFITIISASLIILNLVPITFHGIGLKEGVGVYLYGLIEIPGEIVVATYVIFNIMAYLIATIAFYLLAEEIKNTKKISYISQKFPV